MQRTCDIPGCDRPHRARGWCNRHYLKWKEHGDPLINPGHGHVSPAISDRPCVVEGCAKPSRTKAGMCRGHAQTLARYGTLDEFDVTMARFVAHLRESEAGCWLWTGATTGTYGSMGFVGLGTKGAHRVAWELFRGEIPDQLELDHLCRVPLCVNPWHLDPVTHAENIRRIPFDLQPCGSNAGYGRHIKRREPACPACLVAHAAQARALRRLLAEANV